MKKLLDFLRDAMLQRKTWIVVASIGLIKVNTMLPAAEQLTAEQLAGIIGGAAILLVKVLWRKDKP